MPGLEEPPKTIFVTLKAERRPSQRKQQHDKRSFDYMAVPTSMATTTTTQLLPIFPWEKADIKVRTSSIISSRNHHQQKSNNKKKNRFHHQQHYLLLAILFVTLALTAGALLDGDHDNSGKKKRMRKQRGQHLPASSSKQEGIAEDMFNVYQAMKEDYHTKTFKNKNNQSQWKVLTERDGAKVSLLEHHEDKTCPYIRMETTIPTSVEDCWEFLGIHNWHWSMPKMDPFYDTHEVFSNYTHQDVNMVLIQKKMHRILAFGKRDLVFLSVSDQPLEDGTYVSGTVSVETPDVPRSAAYTRAFQDSVAFYKPIIHEETGEEHCHVTIVFRLDLNDSAEDGSGGFVPMWLYVKTVGATGIKSVLKMKDALLEMKMEQLDNINKSESGRSVAPTSAFPAPIATLPTRSSIVTVPLESHGLATPPPVDKAEQEGLAFKWWHHQPRGGAFVPPSTRQQGEEIPSVSMSPSQRWKPLYGVFSHIPPHTLPQRNTNWGHSGGEFKWRKRISLLGNFKIWNLQSIKN